MDPTLALQFAQGAAAFEDKLARLPDDLDPARLTPPGTPWAWVAALRDPLARRRALARLFPHLVAPWPPLARLCERAPRLALLDRATLLRRWTLLAVAARPGVLRCCIDREARGSLQAALGPAFDALASASPLSRAVSSHAAQWTPMHWACIGYLDWTSLLQPEDAPLRRMARLSLPPGLPGATQAPREAPAEGPAARALALIDSLGLEWTC